MTRGSFGFVDVAMAQQTDLSQSTDLHEKLTRVDAVINIR